MKKLILLQVFLLSFLCVYSQISTEEQPYSWNNESEFISLRSSVPRIEMPKLDLQAIQKEDLRDENDGLPPRFGMPQSVNLNLDNSGIWQQTADGGKIWTLEIYSPDALSINLLYDKFWLPEGGKFYIYSKDKSHAIGAFTALNNKGPKSAPEGFATGLIYSKNIILEYYEPQGVEGGIIDIAAVVSGYRYINIGNSLRSFGSSGSCQVNVNCSEGNNWKNEKNAVALILVDGERYCTGSLINNTSKDRTPYLLTADHCLGGWANNYIKYDAISNPNLSHWSFYWHYESPGCANTSEPAEISTSGATLVANNSVSDFALLRLTENPLNKSNVTPHYLGWDRSGTATTGGVGIHHPAGDVKKIATLTKAPTSNGSYWDLYWSQTANGYSVTEGGSSGSPLINSSRRVIGQLYGGSNVNCSDPSNDLGKYGKLSVSWTGNNNTDNRRRLKDWLDPSNTSVTTLDGLDRGCNTTSTLSNQTITSSRTVTGCMIESANTTISNNATVLINAERSVVLKPNFTAANGTTVIIKINTASLRAEESISDEYVSNNISEEIMKESEISIYPNPTTGIVNIKASENLYIEGIEIYSLNGSLVKNRSSIVNPYAFDLSDLAKGTYIVKVYTSYGVSTQKIVLK